MKTFALFVAFSLGAFGSILVLHAQVADRSINNSLGDHILEQLKSKQFGDLNYYLMYVDRNLDKLNEEELDAIIAQLSVIEASDPYYMENPNYQGNSDFMGMYPNREMAKHPLLRFKFHKIAGELRKLPLEERVNKIIAGLQQQPGKKLDFTSSYARELELTGKEAVPLIVQHQFKESRARQAIMGVLDSLGDPRGIDYIVDILHTPGDDFAQDRLAAAYSLSKFSDQRAVVALIQALKDDTSKTGHRFEFEYPRPKDKIYLARYFPVRQRAAESLSKITGKDWGLLFNEDHATWFAWLNAQDQDTFTPVRVKRAEKERQELITALFHAYMSGRPLFSSYSQNTLASEEGIQALADDLNQLGPSVVPLIVQEYHARMVETPNWHRMLRSWTRKLLLAMDREDAKQAAQDLIKFLYPGRRSTTSSSSLNPGLACFSPLRLNPICYLS